MSSVAQVGQVYSSGVDSAALKVGGPATTSVASGDFDRIFGGVPAVSSDGSSFTLTDGTVMSVQSSSLGEKLLAGVTEMKDSGMSQWREMDAKMVEFKGDGKPKEGGDLSAILDDQNKKMTALVELNAMKGNSEVMIRLQMATMKKSGENIQQLVRG